MSSERIKELEERIAELKSRWPALRPWALSTLS